jgi:Isochorismatase family
MSDPCTSPDFASAALVTIDVQCDVLDDGAFPIRGTSAVLPGMRRLTEAFRQARCPIVHVVRIYEQDGSNAERCRRRLLADGKPLLIRDTPGSQIVSELLPEPALPLDGALLLAGGVQRLGARAVLVRDAVSGLYERGERELSSIGVHLIDSDDVTDALAASASE